MKGPSQIFWGGFFKNELYIILTSDLYEGYGENCRIDDR